jgi:DNA-binding winged helix-turn-helix (wHTH) protein/tetratricopeptide (TPR) repeat protein
MGSREVFHFGEFTLETAERRLTQGRKVIRLAPKAHDVLVLLVRQAGRLVTKDELLSRVWPDTCVEEGILTVHVSALRKAFGGENRSSGYIETVSRSGYRFVAPVTREQVDHNRVPLHARPRPVEIYELVGRGRTRVLSGSYFELSDAVASFRAAIELDSTYAAAHAGLAVARCLQGCLRVVPYEEAFAEARSSALRALAMDSECADAQMALGTVLFAGEWDWTAAERSLHRALEINPSHTEALLVYGGLMEALGRLDEGLHFKEQALARNPESRLVFAEIANSCWNQRRYDDAIRWAKRVLEIDPRHLLAGEFLASAYLKQGDLEQFLAENLRRAELFGVPEAALDGLTRLVGDMRQAYAAEGYVGLARCMLQEIPPDGRGAVALQRAVLHGAAGELDAAFTHLDRALNLRDPALVYLAVAPQWDSLRDDPRFAERVKRMALPPA